MCAKKMIAFLQERYPQGLLGRAEITKPSALENSADLVPGNGSRQAARKSRIPPHRLEIDLPRRRKDHSQKTLTFTFFCSSR